MVGGTIRRKLIHRESFRVSVLHLSEIQAVLQSIATMRCVLTTPSFLSSGTRKSKKPHASHTGWCNSNRECAAQDTNAGHKEVKGIEAR